MPTLSERGWPLASQKRVEKLEQWAQATDKRLAKLEKQQHGDVGLTKQEAARVYAGLLALVNKLKGIGQIDQVGRKGEQIMAANDVTDFEALLAAADVETNRIAQRIADLQAAIVPGMTQADVDRIKAGLQSEVDKLKGVGVVPTP